MPATVESEAQWLRTVILPDLLKSGKLIENDAATEAAANSFKVRDIQIAFIGAEEAFMLTTCYRATVEFELAGVVSTRQFVVKKTPELPQETFDAINFSALFKNEITTYTKILPAIEAFIGKSITTPKYYYSELQRNYATIVLEDFSTDGWAMSKQKVNLPLDHVLLAVKYLGNFHGISFALRHVHRQQFTDITSELRESRFGTPMTHPDFMIRVMTSVDRIRQVTRQYQPQVDEAFLERLTSLISNYFTYGAKRVLPVEPMVTLCHSDFLRNNVAYKYADQNSDKPLDVMMFDLQTMRVASPMIDLTLFLSLSTYAEVRSTHFAQIFNTYYTELAATYKTHAHAELPAYLSNDALLQEFARYMPYSINIAGFFLPNLVVPAEMSSQEFILQERTTEETQLDAMTRGGEVVDRELAHQVKELYDLSVKYNVDICEGFDV